MTAMADSKRVGCKREGDGEREFVLLNVSAGCVTLD